MSRKALKDKAWLVELQTGQGARKKLGVLDLSHGDPVLLGRSKECDLVFGDYDLGISRQHLKLEEKNGEVQLVNIGKSPVVRKRDGRMINGSGRVKVRPGDAFRIASTELIFSLVEVESGYYLEIVLPKNKVKRLRLGRQKIVVGSARRPVNDLCIRDEGVSRQHFTLRPGDDGRFVIKDENSRNGLFLRRKGEEKPVRIEEETIQAGDEFSFGAAVGSVHQGALPSAGRRGKGMLLVAVTGFVVVFMLLAAAGPDEEATQPGPDYEAIFGEAQSSQDLRNRLNALIDAKGTNEFEGRKALERYREVLRAQQILTDLLSEWNRLRNSAVESLRQEPFDIKRYERALRDLVVKHDERTVDIHRMSGEDMMELAGILNVPVSYMERFREPGVAEDYQAVINANRQAWKGVGGCYALLKLWQQRAWTPSPGTDEMTRWEINASLVDDEFAKETGMILREHGEFMKVFNRYWIKAGEIILSLCKEDAVDHVWPTIPREPENAILRKILPPRVDYNRMRALDGLRNKLPAKPGLLDSGPVFQDMIKLIPDEALRKQAKDAMKLRTGAYITKVERLVEWLKNQHGTSHEQVVAFLVRANDKLPGFPREFLDFSGSIDPPGIRAHLDDLRRSTLDLAEKIHADFSFREKSTAVKTLMELNYMKDDRSNRKANLVEWAERNASE